VGNTSVGGPFVVDHAVAGATSHGFDYGPVLLFVIERSRSRMTFVTTPTRRTRHAGIARRRPPVRAVAALRADGLGEVTLP
jgi:hypothetical protein